MNTTLATVPKTKPVTSAKHSHVYVQMNPVQNVIKKSASAVKLVSKHNVPAALPVNYLNVNAVKNVVYSLVCAVKIVNPKTVTVALFAKAIHAKKDAVKIAFASLASVKMKNKNIKLMEIELLLFL